MSNKTQDKSGEENICNCCELYLDSKAPKYNFPCGSVHIICKTKCFGNKWIDVAKRTSLDKARGDAWAVSVPKSHYPKLSRVIVRPKDIVIIRYGQKEE